MNLSLQRQCDGAAEHLRCEAIIEIAATVVGDIPRDGAPKPAGPAIADHPTVKAFVLAWESVAAQLGWRREVGGTPEIYDAGGIGLCRILVPSVKTWVACGPCAKLMKLVCARCGGRECACLGGPRFDARRDDGEDEI